MKGKKTTENWKSLGIPERYHNKLKRLAKQNHRTLIGQVAAMIDETDQKDTVTTTNPKEN